MDITIITDSIYTNKGVPIKALANALHSREHNVKVILPFYEKEYIESDLKFSMLGSYFVKLPAGNFNITLYCTRIDDITCLFISNNRLFARERTWGYQDDALRSAVFCCAALESLIFTNSYPGYIFTDSAHTALIPVYLKFRYHHISNFKHIKSYHYINSDIYGKYEKANSLNLFGIPKEDSHILISKNEINLTKAAIVCATRVLVGENAVSLLYEQVSDIHHTAVQFGFKIRKLRMGIDYSVFSPDFDTDIHRTYSAKDLSGKKADKLYVQKYLYLEENEDIPLVVLYPDRANHVLKRVLHDMLKCDLQVIVISDRHRTNDLPGAPKKAICIGDNSAETLKNIFSAADFSIFGGLNSPCGNPSFIAASYGCVPILPSHRFFDFGISYFNKLTLDGNGYTYDPNIPQDMIYTLWDALGVYRHDAKSYHKLVQNTMKKAFPALDTAECIEKEAEKTSYSFI